MDVQWQRVLLPLRAAPVPVSIVTPAQYSREPQASSPCFPDELLRSACHGLKPMLSETTSHVVARKRIS